MNESRAVGGFDPEALAEVDLDRYLRLLLASWWVVAAGFVFGAVAGTATVARHAQTYRATATLYLGLPYGAGDVALQSAQTNPSTINAIVHSFAVEERVARACKASVAGFDHGISTQEVAGTELRNRQTAYFTLSVLAAKPKLDRCAANGLARETIAMLAPYSAGKMAVYRAAIAGDNQAIREAQAGLKGQALTSAERLAATVQRLALESHRARVRQILLQVAQLERPRLTGRARATRVTARRGRGSVLVSGLIGMILAVVVVIVWDARRRRARESEPPHLDD